MGIREVAERAQVSIATVSQVLNGKGSFSPRTRERVMSAAAELGYRPNPTAAALGAGRAPDRLGVIGFAVSYSEPVPFPLTDNDYFGRLLAAATDQALTRGYALTVGPSTPQTRMWLGLPLDGVVVVDPVTEDPLPTALRGRRTPLVVIGQDPGGPDDVRVGNDPAAAARAVLEHLHDGGCRRPALVGYPLHDEWVSGLRAAFAAWCDERGLASTVWMMDPERSEQVTDEIGAALTEPDAPDGVLCLEDDLATTVEAVAAERGVLIPDALQVVVVSDRTAFPGVAFTTVELDPEGTARAAVDALVDLVEGAEPRQLTEIPVTLVPRDSTRQQ